MRAASGVVVSLAFALAVLGCDDPKHAPPRRTPTPIAAPDAGTEEHAKSLSSRLGDRFTIAVEPPFVIAGDETPRRVAEHARTIRWAHEHLRAMFFSRDPAGTIDVYLFKDAASYRDHALALFGERPSTPYGYFSAANRALIMNIATGEGTLMHEMVHPFIEANLPGCPPWLNEGLASLYERPGEEDGRMIGDTNWRLTGLQSALAAKTAPAFSTLLRMRETEFYGDEQGANYAVARYLLYYLQERDRLVPFMRDFAATRDADPTGEAALARALGVARPDDVRATWETFVLALRFP